MGGDGGVIASNRKYLRGAGSAECTADSKRHLQKQNETAQQQETMTTCAVSKERLDFSKQIAACPHGLLYDREAALEALLRRKQQQEEQASELGPHIRGLKDLHNVHFETKTTGAGVLVPVCPVTGMELNGKVPAHLLVTSSRPNVISERAQKEIGMEALQAEYGPFEEMIRLAPPSSMMKQIDDDLKTKRDKAESNKKKKKRKKNHSKHEESLKKTRKNTVADAARSRVENAVKSNAVLSSLFTSEKSSISEKDKKDNLFVR